MISTCSKRWYGRSVWNSNDLRSNWRVCVARSSAVRPSNSRLIRQLELALDALSGETHVTPLPAPLTPCSSSVPRKPARRSLPAHLPRETLVHATACRCPACGGELRKLGEDVAEILDYVPARFEVLRHVRSKMCCRATRACSVVQSPALPRPLVRSFAGAGLLAPVLVSKYADQLPLCGAHAKRAPCRDPLVPAVRLST